MAGPLQSKISQIRGAGGVLGQTSQEEYQTLAGKAGLQAQPTDPLSAQAIGATPDQAKMAASPQVQQSAMRISQLSPQEGLATAAREAQARTQATADETAEKAKAEKLQNLGDTGARVQSAIDAQVQRLAQTVPTASAQQVDETNKLVVGSKDPVALKSDLQALAGDPTNQQLLLRINKDLGRDQNSLLSPEEIQGLYKTSVQTIAGQAESIPNGLTVQELASQPGFGYSVPELASLLGVDPAALGGYSVKQMSDAVNAMQQAEFSKAQTLENQAASPALGSAERATARDLGKEASATGLRASEVDVARLSDSIAKGDQVTFGGQNYSVEDLLGSDQVSKVVTAYLTSPEGSPTQQQLEHTEPGLVKWIKDNQAVLTGAAQSLSGAVDTFGKTQAANAQVGTYGSTSLPPELLSKLIPGYDSLHAGQIDTSKIPLLQHLSSLSPQAAEAAAGTIGTLSPDQQAELGGLSPSRIAALRLDLGEGSPVIKQLRVDEAASKALAGVSPKDSAVYSMFTGVPGESAQDIQTGLSRNMSLHTLFGTTYSDGRTKGLDANGDGILDSPSSVYAQMKKATTTPSLHDILTGKDKAFSAVPFTPKDPTKSQQEVFDRIGKYAKDGVVSVQDLKDSGVTGDLSFLNELKKTGAFDQMPSASRVLIDKSIQQLVAKSLSKGGTGLTESAESIAKHAADTKASQESKKKRDSSEYLTPEFTKI